MWCGIANAFPFKAELYANLSNALLSQLLRGGLEMSALPCRQYVTLFWHLGIVGLAAEASAL